MFIRLAWRLPTDAQADLKTYRRPPAIPRRGCDDLGVPARDFSKMTRSLFDRQD